MSRNISAHVGILHYLLIPDGRRSFFTTITSSDKFGDRYWRETVCLRLSGLLQEIPSPRSAKTPHGCSRWGSLGEGEAGDRDYWSVDNQESCRRKAGPR